ncbi:flagellar hook protein FlgE [Ectothiorhodospira mobilis]|uniref:flagellar hook protein FlgE n=1 Tax=Ectothiorhodospira mobilis TaxID=195064 RepID=UPI001EE8E4DC|nr:flagellar hook protein FlgE [Ectothiorhodospira mobilis]MCG5535719.1 flagellar hook protein FlgE [Ectothiorhodospira mobilis]
MPFNIGLTGLNAASQDLETTGHNVANASTAGFKGSRAEFADVFALSYTGVSKTATGSGVRLADVAQQFTQGDIEYTDNNLDLAINGQGFYMVERDGVVEYTRAGQFKVDKEGYIVNSAGQRLQGYPTEGGVTPEDIQLTTGESAPKATTAIDALVNLNSDAEPPTDDAGTILGPGDIDPADPETYNDSTSLTVYDSLGAEHDLSLVFQRQDPPGARQWHVKAYLEGSEVGAADLEFNADGSLNAGASTPLTITDPGLPNGATLGDAAGEISVDFGDSTQYGNKFSVTELEQDGYATGQLVDVSVESDGTVFARFTNGANRALGQVALANFDNPQGLQPVGGTNWAETAESGQPLLGRAGESNFGLIQGGAYEASNVDIAEQLVKLITAQRNYQANAQVISTADTITQTIINIR